MNRVGPTTGRLQPASGRRTLAGMSDPFPVVYDELRRLAAAHLAGERPGHTLNPTALVHEAYLRLRASGGREPPDGSGHQGAHAPRSPEDGRFFAAAAEAMRRILIDHARRRGAAKRGGGSARAALDADQLPAATGPGSDVSAVDEALTRLAALDPPTAELVKLRYFAGLTLAEAASALGLAPRTADRLWAFAKAWLFRELGGPA